MHISIDSADPRPIYRQIAEAIKVLVARGALAEGDTLPSVRQLAGDLDVNLNTVATAYRELESEGLIAIRHGTGARIASRRTAGVKRQGLRKNLSGLLADMLLAGMSHSEIDAAVRAELRALEPKSR